VQAIAKTGATIRTTEAHMVRADSMSFGEGESIRAVLTLFAP
jgi:hypothetical protein